MSVPEASACAGSRFEAWADMICVRLEFVLLSYQTPQVGEVVQGFVRCVSECRFAQNSMDSDRTLPSGMFGGVLPSLI